MPPKLRSKEAREEDSIDDMDSVASPLSASSEASAESARSSALSSTLCGSLTAEQLDHILVYNHKTMIEASHHSMATLLATLSSPSSSSSLPVKTPKITVPKWSDEEVPSEYFNKLEKALEHNGVDKATWGKVLPVYLSGKAQAAFAQVDPSSVGDYELVKNTLLESLGDTPASADRKWWSLSRLPGEDAGSFYLRIRAVGIRRIHGLSSREEILEKMILSRFLFLLPADSYTSVVASKPKNGLEAAKLLQEHEENRTYSRRRQPWRSHPHYNSQSVRREQSGGSHTSGNSSSSAGGGSNGVSSGSSPKEQVAVPDSNGAPTSYVSKNGKKEGQNRKPIVCHGCGEPGHIRPRCPHKIRCVRSPEGNHRKEVDGYLAGVLVSGLRIDTGADRSIVNAQYVPKNAFLDQSVILDSWRGKQFSKHRLAKLKIKIGDTETDAVVAVADQLECPALLGNDLGTDMDFELMSVLFEKVKQAKSGSETRQPAPPVVKNVVTKQPVVNCENDEVNMQQYETIRATTRAQEAKQIEETRQDEIASANSDCDPIPLSDILDIQDSFFDQDPVPTPILDSSESQEGCVVDVPLPTLTDSTSADLIKEQQSDSTLKSCWQLALKKEKGYEFHNGILVQLTSDGLGDFVMRILVPKHRRLGVLEMAHSNMLSGHFGVKKTFSRLSAKFLWPKMWPDVKAFIRSCAGCQKAARKAFCRAPLQPLPCEEEPFSKVAFDLVGPLPISASGYRYVLTMMCLFSKFPAAIPLKRVDNITVLDAMFEVFSCFGIPKVLLSDQGSVFTSHLTKLMCQQFQIKKIQTSPYHPQSDGALERWHACLKGMLKRSQCNLKLWDKELKYLLFAYRSTPHVVTGYAPFSLMYGRDVRGPLQILQEAWLDGESDPALVGDWLAVVKAKLGSMAEVVSASR